MGGLTALTEPSPRLYSPPRGVPWAWAGANLCTVKLEQGHALWGRPKGQPFRGGFPSSPPQDGPPNLGVAFARSIPIRLLPIFTDFSDFPGITSSHR